MQSARPTVILHGILRQSIDARLRCRPMSTLPPFRRAPALDAIAAAMRGLDGDDPGPVLSCHDRADADGACNARRRLSDLDPHLHCSIIGTCLTTGELRKLMARFIDVDGASDLTVHHEAVRCTGSDAAVAKALSKALDRQHEAALQRCHRAGGAAALESFWEEALRQGEVPGAYWAVLSSRDATHELRQRVFGDVHMLSHLVGSATRADIRRLVALEAENGELRGRLDRQQARFAELIDERDQAIARLQQQASDAALAARRRTAEGAGNDDAQLQRDRQREIAAAVALQTERRERAERAAGTAADELRRAQLEIDRLRRCVHEQADELAAAERQLRELSDPDARARSALHEKINGRRILYVGGRPSSSTAIRDLVERHGGTFRKHDGGLEDRKGLLAAAVAWAQLVLFPVDCIDHDSANALKRLCVQQGIRFIPLRSASVASFASAFFVTER